MRWILILSALLAGIVSFLAWPLGDLAASVRNKLAWQVQAGSPDLPNVMVTMPDGVRLATDIYLPKGKKPVPAVLMRLPYGKRQYGEVRFWVEELTKRGFAVVAQDMRGRHGSEGKFAPYLNAGADGVETLNWISGQPWSNGKIGTLGCSALGESQFMLAARAHPAHRAMVPIAAGGAIGSAGGRNAYFSAFEGGILNLALTAGWFGSQGGITPENSGHHSINPGALEELPALSIVSKMRPDPTEYEAFLTNFEFPEYWQEMGYVNGDEPFKAPTLLIDTWHDPGVSSTMALADTLSRAGAPVNVVIAAGTHCGYLGADQDTMVGDLSVSPDRSFGFVHIISQFLQHHLADGPAPDLPYISFYSLVEDRWRTAANWPPRNTKETQFFLGGSGSLERKLKEPNTPPRTFLSDPLHPIPSIGGAICCTGNPEERSGPVFQNAIEHRDDLLLYTSAPLDQPLLIAGPVSANLKVSINTPDTDIIVRILDVHPSGEALLVQEGALRLRYRDGFDQPSPMLAGEVYDISIGLRDIAYQFKAGHRLRLHIAGTSFPRLERNLNTGRPNFSETESRQVEISVHSDQANPSKLIVHAYPD